MTARVLPDANVRHTIQNDIDCNMVVEAAAGTGKTTCLVGRLLTLFRRGALSGPSRLAAVTFTHKAAAELRERLDHELESLLANPASLSPEEVDNVRAAAAALPECHIGTIHSFCARLLRERPVEAGIGPDFKELDIEDDLLLRSQAWKILAGEMSQGHHRELVDVFSIYRLDQAQLAEGFATFAEYPDVKRWIGIDDVPTPDPVGFVSGLHAYISSLPDCGPFFHAADPGNDELMPALQIVQRRLPRLPQPVPVDQAYRLCVLFKKNPKVIQKQWICLGVDKKAAKGLAESYSEFYRNAVLPFRDACLATIYASTMQAFGLADTIYTRLRREQGVLNFQDLLLATAAMLENYPGVREDLARRYARLLVDEVQDTDPVQAQIMFLLAADKLETRDWRQISPRPGSLFIVGDPKQSIYRFRRADIVVYQEMKERIRQTGGLVLGLSSNFRSHPDIIDWVNRTYGPDSSLVDVPPAWTAASGRFGSVESSYGPAYIQLEPALSRPDNCFAGVYSLETLREEKKPGIKSINILKNEADRIASFIHHAVATGLALPQRDGTTKPASVGDFLIITYQKASSAVYADALRRLGLPCIVSSGGTLKDSPTLNALREHAAAMAEPDNPILATAVLRNSLFGIPDTELYQWKKAGGTFTYTGALPEYDSPVGAALARLARHSRWYRAFSPVRALEMVIDDLGLWAHTCLSDDPDSAAGAVAAAVDLLAEETVPTVGKLAERLAWLIDSHEEDALPARRATADAVRIMNLHKTKGLEAPVVFLTSTRTVKKHPPLSAIRRNGDMVEGGLVIRTDKFKQNLLAQPSGWEELEQEEECFLAAEKTRLNYVAATRARAALIVSLNPTKDGLQSKFLPVFRPGETITASLPEPPPTVPPQQTDAPGHIDGDRLVAAAGDRQAQLEALLQQTYRTEQAKPEYDWRLGWDGPGTVPPELAARLGEIVHRLVQNPEAGIIPASDIIALLREFELPADWADSVKAMADAICASPVWRRAGSAEQVFREAPFTHCRSDNGVEILERGVIDLVFREAAGWVIVDYKTDRVRPETCREAAKRYAGQLANYARAWQSITGEPVVETGVFFVHAGEYIRFEEE